MGVCWGSLLGEFVLEFVGWVWRSQAWRGAVTLATPSPDLRRYAVPLRWQAQGRPSMVFPFGETMRHWRFA